MNKYFTCFKAQITKHLTYRGRMLIWIFVDMGQFLILPFLWLAIYAGRTDIRGFTPADIITYYILMAFISLASASHAGEYIERDIRYGDLTKALLRPINYAVKMCSEGYAYNFLVSLLALPFFLIFSVLFPEYIILPKSFLTVILFVFSLGLAYILSCLLHVIIGLSAFWLEQSGAAMQMRSLLEKVFGGELAPLTLYPLVLQTIAIYLPFQYLAFIPAQIYLQKIQLHEIFYHFLIAFVWIIFLLLICIFLWKRGLRRYEAPGA